MKIEKYSNFEVGDAVIRRWNNRLYYIIAGVDCDKWEFLIHENKDAKVKDCKVCDMYSNLRLATMGEIVKGYAEEEF